ncbi:MAG: hypothetical protein BWY59_01965 [Verrucomicrobia bacterium ADurb.Bin345]|nr:MAG: hypothetical protein BWY59_01965 [Verrucomicrobia bacterium ADurb.Bin345]
METKRYVEFQVRKGVCFMLYVYDLGLEVDLDQCRRSISAGSLNGDLKTNRRAPRYFDYRPAPLRMTQAISPITVGASTTSDPVEIVLYDFGGVSVTYAVPFQGGWADLRTLSAALCEAEELKTDSLRRVTELLESIRPAVKKPGVSDFVEDYLIFQIEEFDAACPVSQLNERYAAEMAQVLRAETQALSDGEIADAISCRIGFGPDDVALIDWNAALAFDRDMDDVRAVLEYATVELLELRFLDHQLDASLDRSYERILRRTPLEMLGLSRGSGLRQIGQFQVDGAILFERVSNAIKLLGDQYLARVYRLASQRFHLSEWNAGILRKLEAVDNLYEKISDRNANRRLEILEWIIILLIAFEIVWSFVGK